MKPDVGEVREYHCPSDRAGQIVYVVTDADAFDAIVLMLYVENENTSLMAGREYHYHLNQPLFHMSNLVALKPQAC